MASAINTSLLRPRLTKRPASGHKGSFGHLFVIAGSRGFTGAVKLACAAAARSGVGLVTAGIPQSLVAPIAASLVESMYLPLMSTPDDTLSEDALESALAFAEDKPAVAIGPGLSQHPSTRAFVDAFVRQCPAPLVIDADALNCLSNNMDALACRKGATVLTPHPGEMARLSGQDTEGVQGDREGAAATLAKEYDCVVALKGHETIVADASGETYVNTTGNSGLGTGGTGDVLTGLMGGLIAQKMPMLDAALLAVYLHGLAGDLAAAAKTERAMIASDVIDRLPDAWRALEAGS